MKFNEVPRLEFRNLSVAFGPILAVKDFSLTLQPGEVVGLLGHNGAGKSTVVNAATGAVAIQEGMMLIDGAAVPGGATPRDFSKLGVSVVHQEPALAANLNIIENLFLGRTSELSHRERVKRAGEVLQIVGLKVPLNTPVQVLGLGQRQLLDIARGLIAGIMKVIFLDEPTAALGSGDTIRLHALIRDLAKSGTTVVYVSHRLKDVVSVCDRFVVLRDACMVANEPIAGFTAKTLANTLSPGSSSDEEKIRQKSIGPIALTAVGGIEIRSGEILGLFGMAGGDQFEFLEMLYGLRKCTGVLSPSGVYAPASPREAIDLGTYMVQGDRERDSLIPTMSAFDNVLMPWHFIFSGVFGVSLASEKRTYDSARKAFNILGPPGDAPIGSFSGGNRQKHVLARWMVPQVPRVLLLAQPTQGVDEASKKDTRIALRKLASSGVAVVIASAESDEISAISDRAYVMDGGKIVAIARTSEFDEHLLEVLMSKTGRE